MQFALDSEHPEFVRGCEVGALNMKLRLLGDVALHELVRRENGEMLRRMAEASGRRYAVETLDEDWLHVVVEPA